MVIKGVPLVLNQSLDQVVSDNVATDAPGKQAYHKVSVQSVDSAAMDDTYSAPVASTSAESALQPTTQRIEASSQVMMSSPIDSPQIAPKQPRKLGVAKIAFWGLVFGATTLVSALVGAILAFVIPLSSIASSGDSQSAIALKDTPKSMVNLWRSGFKYYVSRPVTILVMGTDRVFGGDPATNNIFSGRSDTMLLVRVDPVTKSVSLLSIPRDTRVELAGVNSVNLPPNLPDDVINAGAMKINRANNVGGPALTAEVVSKALNGVEIDRYVRVSTDAFRELVDLLGGVDVYVPSPMKYDDYTQKLHIDLAQGWQTLDGNQAEQFARFRHDAYGDIGRVQRQQALLKALKKRLTSPTVIPQIPQMMRVMSKYIDTNLTVEEMLALVNFGLDLEQGDFKMVLLPGRFSQPDEYIESYWIMDPQARDRVLAQYFAVKSDQSTGEVAQLQDLRIAIQNASSQPYLGQKVADYLQTRGFRNVYLIEDWPDPQRQTQIVVQRGDQQAANALRQMLGFGRVESDSSGEIESDLTLRIGDDVQQ